MDNTGMRSKEEVIRDIKALVRAKGYIYVLCMILFEDFHYALENMQKVNQWSRLNRNEAFLLLGFLIQKQIDFSPPDDPEELIPLKKKTYQLMEELHHAFNLPFFERLKEEFQKEHKIENARAEEKEFFGRGDMLIEPIFYSGTGAYDIQYLDFLEKKYKYDRDWLLENRNFDLLQAKKIAVRIKDVLHEKAKRIRFYSLKEELPAKVEELKKEYPNVDVRGEVEHLLPMLELHQYVELFLDGMPKEEDPTNDRIREEGWKSFFKGIVELFVVRKSDFENELETDGFFYNFGISYEDNLNSGFQNIGNYNILNSHPILKLDEERYFVTNIFALFEAIYESPFYWMAEDKTYRDQLSENRGKVGEEMVYTLLSAVFGRHRTFKAVTIRSAATANSTTREKDDTDIDVLCVLGSKALCVQVKSKKLTEVSRTGDDEQLQKDFKGAVQDAFEQGLLSRKQILERKARFIDEKGSEISLSEEIDEVYVMGVTTENYPSLTHQVHFMLEKANGEPFPIILTIFDLELLVHYLSDPYDFLYYIRQRVSLMEYFAADEEMVFLGYHLEKKLWKSPESNMVMIETDFGQAIDRNYYPFRAGIEISDEGDTIKNQWKNEDFNRLCDRLKVLDEPKITDIIFHLLDWSGEARKSLVDLMRKMRTQTTRDGRSHNFSMPPDDNLSPRIGATYVSLNSDTISDLQKRLLTLCQARKYRSKGDIWIGFGSLKTSLEIIDAVVFSDEKWEYDKDLETLAHTMLEGKGHGRHINLGKKIGRNDKCPCGSGLKYKHCCGKNR